MTHLMKIYPIPDFKNIPNEKGELPKLEQHKNDKGESCLGNIQFSRWYE